jgi:hypothetical protein
MQVKHNQTLQGPHFHVEYAWRIGKERAVSRCRVAAASCKYSLGHARLDLTNSCVPCLSSGWTLAITEGSLENVFCPSVACTKERATKEGKTDHGDKGITPTLVESVVGKTLRERWERVKENRIVETGEQHLFFNGLC